MPCPPNVPAGATTLAQFQAQGGTVVSGGPVTVSFVDSALTPGPTQGQITRTYTITDPSGSANCEQVITVVDHLECHFNGLSATNFIVPPIPLQLLDPICVWVNLNFPFSHFRVTVSNAPPGFSLTNGNYTGWCADFFSFLEYDVKYTPIVYSSTDPFLPAHLAHPNWDIVNYILNHKQGNGFDIQFAIWNFVGGPVPPGDPFWQPPSPAALALIADAAANGNGFVPGPGQRIAAIMDMDRGLQPRIQLNIIELECQPIDRKCVGEMVTYCVDCTGQAVSYVWTKNGVPIAGQTGPCLSLSNLVIGDSGLYCVRVSGPCVTEESCLSLTVTNFTVDMEPPRLVCPPDMVVPCFEHVPPPDTNVVIVIGDQSSVAVRFVGEVITTNGCEIKIMRTYQAGDTCGNVSVCVHKIIVFDDQPPTLSCGPDKEVECGTDWFFDIPTAVDLCDRFDVLIEVVSTVTNVAQPRCPRIFSVTRTWRATDKCTNSSFCNQTVTIVDTEPPNITCEESKEVLCGTDWFFDIPTAVDKCDLNNVVIEVVSTVTNVAVPRCPGIFSVTRTWRATDTCGNSSFCNQTVTIVDIEPPNITCGQDKEVDCGTDWAFDRPSAVDKCDLTNVVIEVVSTVTNVAVPRCPRIFSVTRTWRATDTCGNSSFCNQTVTVVDISPPVANCPPDRVLECGTPVPNDVPTFFDLCDGTNLTMFAISSIAQRCGNTTVTSRSWTALDSCSNATTCRQTITVVDRTPPSLICGPDRVVECGIPFPFMFSPPTAFDLCSGTNVTVTIVSTVTNQLPCPGKSSVTRTWRATDECTNSSTCSQTVVVVDTEPPALHCGDDRFVECGLPWTFTRPSATDLCDGTNVTVVIVGTVTNQQCGRTISATRTWTATDVCGNSATCSQTIFEVDTMPPSLVCAPNRVLECTTPWTFTPPSALDICDGTNVVIQIVGTVTNNLCGRTRAATRTWNATDRCGNVAVCSQTITEVDTLPPSISCAADRIVECGGAPWNFTPPSALDVCDGTNVVVQILSTVTNNLCGRTIAATRTWKATDVCGNMSVCSQTITEVDTLPPALIGVPANEFLFCVEQLLPPANVTAFDVCDPSVTVRFEAVTNGVCPMLITRCWTAIDDCSNSVTDCQFILINPPPPVVLDEPKDQEVCPGEDASFCVAVSSACPVRYQWTFNGASLTGQTNSCLVVTNVDSGDVGQYCVRITGPFQGNTACFALTNCANLRLVPPPTVIVSSNCPVRGSTVTLVPIITGPGPFVCVWRKQIALNQFVVVGTDCVLTIPNYSTGDEGRYILEVAGRCGMARATNILCPPFDAMSFPIEVTGQNGLPTSPSVCPGSLRLCTPQYECATYEWLSNNVSIANTPCINVPNPKLNDVYTLVARGVPSDPNCIVRTNITIGPCRPDICIVKTADRRVATPGSTVNYTICVTNCGDITLTNVVVTDDNFTPGTPNDDIVLDSGFTLQPNEGRCYNRSVIVPQQNCGTNSILRTVVLPNGDVEVTFIENRNNNTYGANTIGWTRDHSFNNLVGSDNAEFQFKNGAGQVVLQFKQDYISRITPNAQFPAGYRSLGATGGDGGLSVGNASDIVAWSTSLEQNLNKEPFLSNLAQYTVDSPATSDPNFPLWEVRMIYMNTIKASVFGASGFGQVSIASAHNSPGTTPLQIPCDDICLTNKATATARAANVGGVGTPVMAMDTEVVCTSTNIECIDVIKEIACLLPGDNCGLFGKEATGLKGLNNPAFCYQITLTNCGPVALTNVTVLDDKLGDLTTSFFGGPSGTLPVGGSIRRHVKMAWGVDTTNTVTVRGRGDRAGGVIVTDQDRAIARVRPIGLTCEMFATAPCDLDGNPNDNHVRLPADNSPCAVTFSARVCNTGSVALVNVTVNAPGCATPAPFSLAPGACVNLVLCTRTLRCNETPAGQDMTVTAEVGSSELCAHDFNGQPIRAQTDCRANVDCGQVCELQLNKRASSITASGQVTYTYSVTNTGGTTVTDITIVDDNGTPGLPADDFEVGTTPSLAPGASMSFTRTVTVPVRLCDADSGLQSGLLITEVLPDGNIRATFIQDFNVNNNTYGVNSIGWGSKIHKFSNLTGSDQAEFEFRDGSGQVVLRFQLDYISQITPNAEFPAGYRSLGVTGGDGGIDVGNAASVVAWNTSLEENLNKQPFLGNLPQYTVDSPSLSDPNTGQWEYRMIYSAVVDKNVFGASGFGTVMITDQHNSPGIRGVEGPVPCGVCVTNIASLTARCLNNPVNLSASAVVCNETNPPPPTGNCPLSASDWKKSGQFPPPYTPSQTVGSVFDKAPASAASKTLLEALDGKAGSGDVKDLLKEGVAALLNAASANIAYPFEVNDVIDGVNMALMNGSSQALKSLKDLLKDANENDKNCGQARTGNCDTDGKPNVLVLQYNGQSCAEASNSQMAISGKTSCTGDPADAPVVRIVASDSSSPPTASSARFFDEQVSLGGQFQVNASAAGQDTFRSNTYFHLFVGGTLVQTIQLHTSCSAPLVRGETFGALVLVDYRIE